MEGRIETQRTVRIIGNGESTPTPSGNTPEEPTLLTDSRTYRVKRVGGNIELTLLQTGIEEPTSSPE